MSFVDSNGLSAADVAAVTGGNGGFGTFGGMSGHSLKDRMIAKLEGMYDEATSEYEREELRKEIRRIEAEK